MSIHRNETAATHKHSRGHTSSMEPSSGDFAAEARQNTSNAAAALEESSEKDADAACNRLFKLLRKLCVPSYNSSRWATAASRKWDSSCLACDCEAFA